MKKPLHEYRMLFERVPEGQKLPRQPLGLRSKLGGKPDWEQTDEWPECWSCDQPMTFVAQIDSMEHDSKENPHRVDMHTKRGEKFIFADVGMIYVFFCFQCSEAQAMVQSG